MESTGKAGAIQVTEETCLILKNFNYTFEQRGLVAVKGKGQLMTYYLIGKNSQTNVQTIESSLNIHNEINLQEAKQNGIATTTSEFDPLLNGEEVNLETNEQK
jgi:adenylate cyclase 3